ncbi:hypothetical protein MAF45_04395 [Mesosutterella sp. OilRF-GAM-744-9]|uniref:Uncharacterized protein n=1 Tax=Mesosutterella porci TaxID=2915351 RepID=A0ABS9MPY8_9BURK|nr:hypothetical protein [Mesosutterella sp. oilRF-744-WT-GAM-9]MCG5030684.1 hypothetical protein [Mesosutterella sp. oilRF-744-WT-GAM-9]
MDDDAGRPPGVRAALPRNGTPGVSRRPAEAAVSLTGDALDATQKGRGKDYLPGDQAWYTHFRIGRVALERYAGSQFPQGAAAQNQFFRQMTPNTGSFDARAKTGRKPVYIAHAQGCSVVFQTDLSEASALVLIEPGRAPQPGSPEFEAAARARIPVIFYYGDYIGNGPKDIDSTAFWQKSLESARVFAKALSERGVECRVVSLPEKGIRGNSHFHFEEENNAQIASLMEADLEQAGLRLEPLTF